MSARLEVLALDGMPPIGPGDDLAALVAERADDLRDGDVVVVTSKVVSKAEGRVERGPREHAIEAETRRVVARRGPTTIARTRHGLTLAAAGVDASNTEPGTVVLLPLDPDASARRLRRGLRERTGRNVAVVVSDTAGRPWREGQTDLAVGCAGLLALDDHEGRLDEHGNTLSVTAPAIADEVASAADLVKGKLAGRPVALVRGLGRVVLGADEEGPGAASLVRGEAADMFVLGSREAVETAVRGHDAEALAVLARSGTPAELDVLARVCGPEPAVHDVAGGAATDPATDPRTDPRTDPGVRLRTRALRDGTEVVGDRDDLPTAAALERLRVLGVAYGWMLVADDRNTGRCRIVLRKDVPGP